jgi:glycosyltransferase involved in cell wall biosynthesis
VVGTLSGGNIELLEDGVNCLTIRAADPGGLADALCRLLADSNLAHTIAAEGQRLIREKFTIEAAVAHTDRLYHELISRTASSNRRSTSAAVQ